mmetsp:Transcript_48124/g.127420  ORF Transcript_48124/g.127420 Transcript_48124/m.127420 type:complete len:160 (-) Transcript_48124:230-709(-)
MDEVFVHRSARGDEMPRRHWRRQINRHRRPRGRMARATSPAADVSTLQAATEPEEAPSQEGPSLAESVGDQCLVLALSRLSGAGAMSLRIRSSDTVSQVKQVIAQEEGTPAWQQRLLLGSTILQDFQTISSYGPFEESHLLVTLIHDSLSLPIKARQHR